MMVIQQTGDMGKVKIGSTQVEFLEHANLFRYLPDLTLGEASEIFGKLNNGESVKIVIPHSLQRNERTVIRIVQMETSTTLVYEGAVNGVTEFRT